MSTSVLPFAYHMYSTHLYIPGTHHHSSYRYDTYRKHTADVCRYFVWSFSHRFFLGKETKPVQQQYRIVYCCMYICASRYDTAVRIRYEVLVFFM